jgi:signal transduction histidine kinase
VFGVGIQATPWLYTFWHFGFSAAVLVYACIKYWSGERDTVRIAPARAAWLGITTVLVLVCALTWAVVGKEPYLPPLLKDQMNFTPAANYVTWAALATSLVAFVLLAVRRTSVLDLWVTVTTLATVLEQAITSFFTMSRFSVGFYTGRILAVVASTIVLVVLLSETIILYGRLARYTAHLQRERAGKLLNAQVAVASVIHQIRQPLTGIGTRAAAARRFLTHKPPDIDRVQRIQDEIVGATSHANEAIESIRALFKDPDQPQSLIDLNELVVECLQLLQQELDEHGIAVGTELDAGLPLIAGHRGQLREVVLNLMQNAIEAMAASANRPRNLRLETKWQDRGGLTISVQDTGPGIEQQSATRIFDASVTTKAKGTGLGLALSRMIAELHGGRIFAHSDPGGGARFQIALPIETTSEK